MIEKMKPVAKLYVGSMQRSGWNSGDFAVMCAFRGLVPPDTMLFFVVAVGPVSAEAVQDALAEECESRGMW